MGESYKILLTGDLFMGLFYFKSFFGEMIMDSSL